MSLLKILALDKEVITYRKELNPITGSITATILLQQFIYWDEKNNHQPFYKFIEPCNNEKYTNGDSWTEELGFSKYEFTSALKKLEDLGIVSKKINMARVTYYTLNITNLAKLIKPIYVNEENQSIEVDKTDLDNSKSFDTETTTETTTDIKKEKRKKQSLKSQIETKLSEYQNINIEAFNEWMEYKNHSYKTIAPITKIINFLVKYPFEIQQEIINTSIMNEYQGLFPPRQKAHSNNTLHLQTLNPDVNVWDEIARAGNNQQGVING